MKKYITLTLSLLCTIAFGKVIKTPESEEAARIWGEVFQNKPVVSLEDSRVLVKMFLLSPTGRRTIPARDMGLADIISQFGTHAVRNTVSVRSLLERAQELKGDELSGEEREKIQKLAERQERTFMRKHPDADKFNFLIKDDAVSLHHTVKGEKTVDTALAAIARQHGLCCNYRKSNGLPVEELQLLLCGGNPVLLEERKTGKWLMAFGAWGNGGKTFVFLNDIENTTVAEGKPRGNADERQSMYLEVIKSLIAHQKYVFKNKKYAIVRDIVSEVSLAMPQFGFAARTYNPGDYQAHVMTDWRESAEAWDSDLQEILKNEAVPDVRPAMPAADAEPNLLWNHYFHNTYQQTDKSAACLQPVTAFRLESASVLQASLVSLITCQDATPWKFSLIPNMMWVAMKEVPGNALLCPTQEELDALVRLGRERELVFKKRFEAFTGKTYLVISGIDNPEKRLESPHDEKQTSEWILSLLDNAAAFGRPWTATQPTRASGHCWRAVMPFPGKSASGPFSRTSRFCFTTRRRTAGGLPPDS